MHIDPRMPASGLPVAAQQAIKIAKAISLDVRVLIMDEPTAALSAHEVERLFASRTMHRHGLPVVLVDRRAGARGCSVAVDDVEGGALAVSHLVEQGHEHVAFVAGPPSAVHVADRLEGTRRAMRSAGRPPEALVVVETSALNGAEGRRAGEVLAGLPRARRPTAAFCANDLVALGVLQQMTRLALDVPRELAIVGYDDIEFAGIEAIPLSSVRQPRALLGRTAGARAGTGCRPAQQALTCSASCWGNATPRSLVGLWLVEGFALQLCARQRLGPGAPPFEELGHVVLGAVDDSADLLVDQLLGSGRGR